MAASAPRNEPTVESHLAYQGRVVTLRVDKVRLPNGSLGTREVVEHSECVCIVPVDADGNVVLVRQYRKPAQTSLLEIPAGNIEDGEAPEEAAQRELQEETGCTAGNLRHLASFWTTPGFCTELMHAYLATDLRRSTAREPDEDEDIEVVTTPLERIPQMIRSAEIKDAKSIASLLIALQPYTGG